MADMKLNYRKSRFKKIKKKCSRVLKKNFFAASLLEARILVSYCNGFNKIVCSGA